MSFAASEFASFVTVIYGLLILFGQFVAQGVVEEKTSRVVELLLGAGLIAAGRRRAPVVGVVAAGADHPAPSPSNKREPSRSTDTRQSRS